MIITAKKLKEKNACWKDMELFILYFGSKIELTEENVRIAGQLGLDLGWFVDMFFYGGNLYIEDKRKYTHIPPISKHYFRIDIPSWFKENRKKQIIKWLKFMPNNDRIAIQIYEHLNKKGN